jgi:hypothetical protein
VDEPATPLSERTKRGSSGLMKMGPYCLSCVLTVSISLVSVSDAHASSSSTLPLTSETAATSETGAETIEYLIAYVEQSKLTFIRNGQEHDSGAAAAHMRHKYEYFKVSIATPEEFIEQIASKSLLSGRPYMVRLPGGREAPVGAWLRDVLEKHRH